MITKTTGYKASDGTVHETIDGAQQSELTSVIARECGSPTDVFPPDTIARLIVKNRTEIIDILTTGPKSRPKARAVNGAKKPRRSRSVVESQPAQS